MSSQVSLKTAILAKVERTMHHWVESCFGIVKDGHCVGFGLLQRSFRLLVVFVIQTAGTCPEGSHMWSKLQVVSCMPCTSMHTVLFSGRIWQGQGRQLYPLSFPVFQLQRYIFHYGAPGCQRSGNSQYPSTLHKWQCQTPAKLNRKICIPSFHSPFPILLAREYAKKYRYFQTPVQHSLHHQACFLGSLAAWHLLVKHSTFQYTWIGCQAVEWAIIRWWLDYVLGHGWLHCWMTCQAREQTGHYSVGFSELMNEAQCSHQLACPFETEQDTSNEI